MNYTLRNLVSMRKKFNRAIDALVGMRVLPQNNEKET